ncbi:HWE histidine kinase domain-containing protein [Sphingomonas sp. GB1N7]|uniref:HWE histidine kinase domain-containing protein n=1 Tax=Parasphingomonas caseinilytica TaxID=3096158 RepID=UPI002FC5895D
MSNVTAIFNALDAELPTIEADPSEVDLTNCDREPIHVPGLIQPFGFLVAVSTDWLVSRVSANVGDFSGLSPDHILGKPLRSIFSDNAEHALRNLASQLRGVDAIERAFNMPLMADGALFDVAVHYSGRSLVIEAEPVSESGVDAALLVRTMVVRLDQIDAMETFLREGARQIRALTGFDRVMVYRFDAVGSGEVVAEALRTGVDSFFGLNYPASDIPTQARLLYLRSVFRIIADVASTPVPIIPVLDFAGEPLDQSISVLRAVSPIHIEYLLNMGVQASMSISIIVDGKLWGLFACHHYAPRLPSFAHRSAAELFGRMFSMMLERRERQIAREYAGMARAVADQLTASAARDRKRLKNAGWLGDVIFGAIPADGIGVSIEGDIVLTGLTPNEAQFSAVIDQLNRLSPSQVFATDNIASHLPDATAFADKAVGLLAIPTSRSPRDYVVLFRTERLHAVRWAGNPEKEIQYGPNGPRLTPRKSFEAWSKLVEGTSLPFTTAELQVAETLRVALLEIVLQLLDAAGRERAHAIAHQETLIAELNHRVRNILSLIRGLISQTRDSALTADAFVTTLDNRVQALARAHDQLTAERWGPARLIDLILTETHAYLGEKRERIMLDGPNVLIDPTAFTALALVVHELVTNAAKYGALSDSGNVRLHWSIDDSGNLAIRWREADGPPVTPPTRKGFGSTIIEQSIPYDLGGQADVSYASAGFEADFVIPARFVGEILPDAERIEMPVRAVDAVGRPLEGCVVLLVEDSMIIALDCEDNLRELGAQEVYTAATVDLALALIEERQIDFAILDFNLGDETSLAAAHRLVDRNVPFAFATGYGDAPEVRDSLAKIEVIRKPYNAAALAIAIKATGPLAGRR